MKHIKVFESIELTKLFSNIALYLEEIQPVNQKDGFIECLYDDSDPFELSFYFKDWTDEEEFEKFYKFLEDNDLKIYNERTNKVNDSSTHEIIVKPNRRQLRKLKEEAKMWDNVNKYNL